jgi:hypothetical protein
MPPPLSIIISVDDDILSDRRFEVKEMTHHWVAQPDVFTLLDTARAMVGGGAAPDAIPTRLVDCPCPKCAVVADPVPG